MGLFFPLLFFRFIFFSHSAEIPGDDLFSLRTCHSYFLRFPCITRSCRRLVFSFLAFPSLFDFSLLSSFKRMAQDARVKWDFLFISCFLGFLVSLLLFLFLGLLQKGLVGWLETAKGGEEREGRGFVYRVGKRRENRLIECPTTMFAHKFC